jgi:hypothetical protein
MSEVVKLGLKVFLSWVPVRRAALAPVVILAIRLDAGRAA